MKTSELTGPALDWAVAKCEGYEATIDGYGCVINRERVVDRFEPSTNWGWSGPIIEREGVDIQQVFCYMEGSFSEPCGWQAIRHTKGGPINPPKQIADTPLIAAMRCYVASKLGPKVDIPEELL